MKPIAIVLIGLLLTIGACEPSCDPNIVIRFSYVDKAGRDLYNPTTPNFLKASDLKLFRYENKIKTLYDGGAQYQGPDVQTLLVYDLMLLELSPTMTDTIASIREKCKGVTKITYNGVLIRDFANNLDNRTIVK